MRKSKNAIGPVVATALLIVVSVIAVIGFQNWFGSYSGDVFVDVELKSSQTSMVRSIETIVGNQLYIKAGDNTSIKQILIDGKECSFTGNITGVESISVADCINNLSMNSPEVVVVLEDRILSKTIYLKDASVSSLDIGSECRFKDDKSACGSYYVEKTIGNIDAIEDTILGLYWQKDMNSYLDYDGTTLTWAEAKIYCSGLDGGNGWRLPTLIELESSLVDTSRASSPYIVDVGFTNVQSWYWTNTKYSIYNAYVVYFAYGLSYFSDVSSSPPVVCVKTV